MAKSTLVSIVHTSDPVEGPKKALDMIGAGDILSRYERVLIKPNYVNSSRPETGVTTDPRSSKGSSSTFLTTAGAIRSSPSAREAWRATTRWRRSASRGWSMPWRIMTVTLYDLNAQPHVEVDIPGGKSLKSVRVAKPFLDYDCILSVPKLKVHVWSLSTLSMKNMMGGILPKGIMHDDLHQKIVDLNRVFGPGLTVIDGIVGCQGHELACDPINSDVIVAGEDFVATDAVGSFLMGLCPDDIPYLKLAKKAGMGENEMEKIEYAGETISKLRKYYRM